MFFSLLLLFFSSPAQARDCSAEFKSAGAKIPQALLQKGYRRFGNLDLRRLLADMKTVTVIPSDMGKVTKRNNDRLNSGRATARWVPGQITIACDLFNRFPEKQPMLAFHEYLGATGYTDQNYRGSVALWLLSRNDAHRLLRASEKGEIEKWASAKLNGGDGGGVVGVGGGGEIGTIFIRTQRIEDQLARLRKKTRESERKEIVDWIYQGLLAQNAVTWR